MHGVRNEPRSLYEILGVEPDATPQQIERAYQRFKREQQRETTPPDQRLRVMIEHAHDVLMDPARREQYDNDSGARTPAIVRKLTPARIAALLTVLAAAGGLAWGVFLRDDTPALKQDVSDAVAMAVGRVVRIEPSGARTPLGLAFAIAEGTLVTSCEGITPAAELLVDFGKRGAPVRATGIDAPTQLCKLGGNAVGSWPLTVSSAAPQPGQTVYVVGMTGASPQVKQGTFGRLPPRGDALGAPVLDTEGHVVAAASRVDGSLVYVPVPRSWLAAETAIHSPAATPPKLRTVESPSLAPDMSPARRERLEKAFRPPIEVPPDL